MSAKKTRQDVLRIIIQNKSFDNQEELLADLKSEGFNIAQPTLSRDLKQLKASKVYNKEGKYTYVMPSDGAFNHVNSVKRPKERLTQSYGFLSLNFSGDIAVLKTLHGYANSLAAEIDEHDCDEILGSLAGDDTVLLVLKEGADRQAVYDLMKEIIPRFDQ
ncbi:MAG: arginine repressor [Bacteroidaceae bacterium]|jgi:transcriptional regulator of arginine metabolism|nr:arginine repressor [Bacteroidaceae bacterium]